MSDLKVEVVEIDGIEPHPNADRLELAVVAGWNCVVRKGEYVKGQKVVYIPIDSILPPILENALFPPDSKVRLDKSRIRTIKLRGAVSQGLIVTLDELGLAPNTKLGTDVAETLGITKYEPPVKSVPASMRGNVAPRKAVNSHFHKYTDIQNFKYYNTLFAEGEEVYVSEKLHGTSARYGWLPTEANTLWKKIKRLFGYLPEWEFCYGSRNVQLQDRTYDGFYTVDVYAKILEQENLKHKAFYNEVIYGEIVGCGIQGNYTYGCVPGESRFFAYDVQRDGKWLDYAEFVIYCDTLNIPRVPQLYVGPYNDQLVRALAEGDSLVGQQKVREGVVIKPVVEQVSMVGRKVLKLVSDTYLLKDQTDFH